MLYYPPYFEIITFAGDESTSSSKRDYHSLLKLTKPGLTAWCEICGTWMSKFCCKEHCNGNRHRKNLGDCLDQIIRVEFTDPTKKDKIDKLIRLTVKSAIKNVLRYSAEKYYNDENRYRRYTGMELADGISSVQKLLGHQEKLIAMMVLPDDLSRVTDDDSTSYCPYGCLSHSFEEEEKIERMITRVEGLKIALRILITNFDKDTSSLELDTTGCMHDYSDGSKKPYEDSRWCVSYQDKQ